MGQLYHDLIEGPEARRIWTHQVVTEALSNQGGGKKIQQNHGESLNGGQGLLVW